MLSVSPRTIQNYLQAKMLAGRKIGRRTVITLSALENFLRADRQLPRRGGECRRVEPSGRGAVSNRH